MIVGTVTMKWCGHTSVSYMGISYASTLVIPQIIDQNKIQEKIKRKQLPWIPHLFPLWLWSYGSWIYNYLCNQCLSPLKLWIRIPLISRLSYQSFNLDRTWSPHSVYISMFLFVAKPLICFLQIFWFWAYIMQVISKARCGH
jgi:hypothetical protein